MMLSAAAATLNDDRWEYPINHKHQQYICEFMSFFHGRADEPYARNKQFTKEELLEIRPIDVKEFLLFKAFQDPNP